MAASMLKWNSRQPKIRRFDHWLRLQAMKQIVPFALIAASLNHGEKPIT
jgi:hypothetical protein